MTIAAAAEAGAAGPLAGLPSPPGPHVRTLEALPDDTWVDLGPPAADPRWGRARGRSWTPVMPYAPALGGAFLYGEGVHGWTNPETGRYMDDLWFYDVNGHRWINVHPGTDTRNPPDVIVNEDGFVALANGDPVPIATQVHGYHMNAWDPVRRRLVSRQNRGLYFKNALPGFRKFLEENESRLNVSHASPWMYDVDTNRWLRFRTTTRSAPTEFAQTFLYLPSIDRFFLRGARSTWLFDPERKRWQSLAPAGPPPPFGIEASACHDAKRDRIMIGGGKWPQAPQPNGLWIYDVAANAWIDPQPGGHAIDTDFSSNIALMHCDEANDVVLLVRHRGNDPGVFVYDIAANTWTRLLSGNPPLWPDLPWGGARANGFYHPQLNVHVFHLAGDSVDNGTMLAYRYRRPAR